MIRNVMIGVGLLITAVAGQGGDGTSLYSRYEVPKVVTELEWRLLLIEVKLGDECSDLLYNPRARTFEATYWLLATEVTHDNTSVVRRALDAQADRTAVLLERYFPEIKGRIDSDLRIEWRLGAPGVGVIAVFENGSLDFTDGYYKYLREMGKR